MLPSEAPAVLERIRAELDLVDVIAKRVSRVIGAVIELEDLVGAGREGLLDAARRYDAARGASFRTYAGWRIFGAIVDSARQTAGLPRRTYERLSALRAAGFLSEGRLEPVPIALGPSDEGELEETLIDEAAAFVTAAALGSELSDEHQTDGGAHLGDGAGGHWTADPEQAFMRAELLGRIREGVEGLPPDEKSVLKKVYYENQSLADAARQLDCGKPWTTRLHKRGIQRLSQRLKPRI